MPTRSRDRAGAWTEEAASKFGYAFSSIIRAIAERSEQEWVRGGVRDRQTHAEVGKPACSWCHRSGKCCRPQVFCWLGGLTCVKANSGLVASSDAPTNCHCRTLNVELTNARKTVEPRVVRGHRRRLIPESEGPAVRSLSGPALAAAVSWNGKMDGARRARHSEWLHFMNRRKEDSSCRSILCLPIARRAGQNTAALSSIGSSTAAQDRGEEASHEIIRPFTDAA
jgi:hypothetical protein